MSKLRGLWTENPDFLIEHSDTLDITTLALAVPFGLLPAADPRLLRTAEAILRAHEAQKGDPNVLARPSYEPAGSSCERRRQRFARRLEPGHVLDGAVPDRGSDAKPASAVLDSGAGAL